MVRATPYERKSDEVTPPMPPFTIKQLHDAVPAHCFQRSVVRSFSYVLRDLLTVAALFYAATFIELAPIWGRFLLWPLYWVAQGSVMTGVWVLAHECGHQAFSDYKWLNDAVGLVLHSALLVPYHSWRITHGTHHKNTNHMDRDTVFVPSTRSEVREAVLDSPLVNLLEIVVTLTIGWPGYLLANVASQKYGRRTNHFEPSSPLFKDKDRRDVVVSDVGVGAALLGLAYAAYATSAAAVACYYLVPYLVVNFFLVLITYLQHTHRDIPHYRGEEWTFVRGALSTIDRDFGVFNELHHHIADTHIAHHLFSTMPHYHAQEATAALKGLLGKHYNYSDAFFLKALYENWTRCKFVEDSGDLLVFKSRR